MSRRWRVIATCLGMSIVVSAGVYGFGRRAERQRLAEVHSHLTQIALALQNYAEFNRGRLPPAAIRDGDGRPLLSWRVLILPYLENVVLYEQFKLDEPWDSPHNRKALELMPPVYGVANSNHATHYRVFGGTGTAFDETDEVLMSRGSFPDGYEHTILVIESQEAVPWTKPEALPYAPGSPLPKLGKAGAKQFATVSAAAIAGQFDTTVDEVRLRAAITRNGAERTGLTNSVTSVPPWNDAVSDLIRCVCSKECDAIGTRVNAVKKEPAATDAAVRALIPVTVDLDAEINSRAVTAIGEFGPAAINPLIEAVPGLELMLRENVVRLIALLGVEDVPGLIQHLGHTDPAVRDAVARALGSIEPFPNEAIPQLVEQLADGEPAPRIAAIRSLSQADAETLLPELTKAFDDERVLMRRNAVLVAGYLQSRAAPAVPNLIELLKDQEPFVRQEAASSLSAIGPAATKAIPFLEAALHDHDLEVRSNVQYALESLRRHQPAALGKQ